MKIIYLKGIDVDNKKTYKLSKYFDFFGMNLHPLFSSYETLAYKGFNELKNTMSYKLTTMCPYDNKINLVCDSIGSNLGVILAKNDSRINKLILFSPEFVFTNESKKEAQKNISNKIDEMILFCKTQNQAFSCMNNLDTDTLVVTSLQDKNVSRKYIQSLNSKNNITNCELASAEHDILMNKPEKSIQLIKNFLRR